MDFGATYSSVLIFSENNKVLFSKSSNPEWSEEFTSTGLYKHCHLLSEANAQMQSNQSSFTLVWDLYKPTTDKANELNEIRQYKDITHGVGFCTTNPDGSRIILSVAGKYSDFNFGLSILRNRAAVFKSLRQFISK
ncbi:MULTISPECIES: hypothetical protein [unclassified Legionella]|uniref:hypothetical protein n=1 Tax=unclassified Legionella TaxID=2622702 RepID=UPI001055E66D|nr:MULTISPECIES: hypothetical protein [unclassified Legionella]MDI9818630.1 hypothetical protein [Legionella sp. PL877]